MLQQLCVNTPSASLVGDVQEMEWQEMKKSKQIWQRLVVYKRTPRQCGHLIIAQQLRSQLALGAHSSQYPEVRAVVFLEQNTVPDAKNRSQIQREIIVYNSIRYATIR